MLKSLSNYTGFSRWFIKQSILKHKGLVFLIFTTATLGVFFQLSVFLLIINFAKHFTSGEMIQLLGFVFDPRTSINFLVLFSLGVVLSLFLSSILVYLSHKYSFVLGERFEKQCVKWVVEIFCSSQFNLPVDKSLSDTTKYLSRLVRNDARWANWTLIKLVGLFVPILTMLIAFAAMFYIEPVSSLLIIVLVLLFSIVQYRYSRGVAEHSRVYEHQTPLTASYYRNLFAKKEVVELDNSWQDISREALASDPVKKQIEAFVGRLKMVEKSKLVSGFFLATVVGLTLLIMGAEIINEGYGWGRLLIFIIALRFALVNLQSIFAAITAINRYYPQVSRLYLFIVRVK